MTNECRTRLIVKMFELIKLLIRLMRARQKNELEPTLIIS